MLLPANNKVLVLGAYGFIGASVMLSLREAGCKVTGLVRNASTARKVLPGFDLVLGDLRHFTRKDNWQGLIDGYDFVVNCAGALQDGGEDDLNLVHHRAIAALGQACADQGIGIVQISATGAEPDANTAFMQTKAAGDAALAKSGAALWILKPGLVIGQTDYGGTALLRMLAAVPMFQPLAYPNAPVQCVGMNDLCKAVGSAIRGALPQGTYDLVEDRPHKLSDIIALTREWLGFRPARFRISLPNWIARLVAKGADSLSLLGWRSPLRSTAMKIMAEGVQGDPEPYRLAMGKGVKPVAQTYFLLPCAREHRLAARMALLMPLAVATLSVFWVFSGVFGLAGLSQASAVLTDVGWPTIMAMTSVVIWSLADIALGLAVLWRPWAKRACQAQIAVSLFYLVLATMFVPALWLDPMGPLVKILPAMFLSLVVHQLLESR
ncbi:MAG: SDR family oxidoreductase [Ruegeria sp.]